MFSFFGCREMIIMTVMFVRATELTYLGLNRENIASNIWRHALLYYEILMKKKHKQTRIPIAIS